MRYIVLCTESDDGVPDVDTWADADRDEVTPCVNEDYPEVTAVLIPEVTTVTKVTEHADGSKTTETYQTQTGNMIPDPSGATEETGVTLTRVADRGGALNVYQGKRLVKSYASGEWRACTEEPPVWMAP